MKDRFTVQWRRDAKAGSGQRMLCSLVRTLLLSPHWAPWWKKSLINRLRPLVQLRELMSFKANPGPASVSLWRPPFPTPGQPPLTPPHPLGAVLLLSGEDRGGTGKSSEKVRGSVRVLWQPPIYTKKAENPEVSLLAWLRSFIVNNISNNNNGYFHLDAACWIQDSGGGGGERGFVRNNTDMFYFTFLQKPVVMLAPTVIRLPAVSAEHLTAALLSFHSVSLESACHFTSAFF